MIDKELSHFKCGSFFMPMGTLIKKWIRQETGKYPVRPVYVIEREDAGLLHPAYIMKKFYKQNTYLITIVYG